MIGWTPRPPRRDEPACWSWPVPPYETPGQVHARLIAENAARPDPDDRVSEAAIGMMLSAGHGWDRFNAFHDGRCAVCSAAGVIEDHCHNTGQIRGYTCRSCNVREGRSGVDIFVRYRRIHPAAILDLHEMYDGIGWTNGWSWVIEGAAAKRRGLRPPTPWPAWSPDTPLDQGLSDVHQTA